MQAIDWACLEIYVEAAMRNATELDSCGISLRDGKLLEPDRARLGSAINSGILELARGRSVLRFTALGWKEFCARC
jgi:hypothetical protein